jgi:hypothetical protein
MHGLAQIGIDHRRHGFDQRARREVLSGSGLHLLGAQSHGMPRIVAARTGNRLPARSLRSKRRLVGGDGLQPIYRINRLAESGTILAPPIAWKSRGSVPPFLPAFSTVGAANLAPRSPGPSAGDLRCTAEEITIDCRECLDLAKVVAHSQARGTINGRERFA